MGTTAFSPQASQLPAWLPTAQFQGGRGGGRGAGAVAGAERVPSPCAGAAPRTGWGSDPCKEASA